MRLEAARIVADWLGHATYGVNAKLALLSLDGADVRPANVATIVDETRNAHAAFRRFDGLTLPAIVVTIPADPVYRDGELVQTNNRADADIAVQARYAVRKLSGQVAIADGNYMAKAIMASLRELHKNENVASRTRNNVALVSCTEMAEQGVYEEVEDTWLICGVQVRYYACDLVALGA